jgi:5-methylcytosine-specific restriction endonuclease McrA
MKRLNPDTGQLWKKGEYHDNGKRFWGYSNKKDKKGYNTLVWRSQESFEKCNKIISKLSTERNKRPENRAERIALYNKRRSAKIHRTPPWLTKEHFTEIKAIYQKAQALKDFTGEDWDVDHIVPLQGELVCGLHVPWNLRVITSEENRKKNNTHHVC